MAGLQVVQKQSGREQSEFYRESMQSPPPPTGSSGAPMLSLNGSAELTRLKAQQQPAGASAASEASAADRVLRATQRAVDSALGSAGRAPPESEEALRSRWATSWQQQEKDSDQQAASAVDVRASQGSTTLDDQFYLLPTEAAHQLAGSAAAGELRSSGRIPDKLVWKRPVPGAVFSDVVDVPARTVDDVMDGVTENAAAVASGDIELADEGIATMTLRQGGSGLRQGAACESPPQRLGNDEEAENEGREFGETAARQQQPQPSAGDVADCRRLLASRKVGGGGGGSGGRVVHPRVLPPQQQPQQVAATAAATAAVAMAEPLIRGQQQVEANIGRLLERLERLEAERAVSAGGQQPKQEEERRLREQLDRLLADRLSQLEQLQREQLRMQQELLMQQHRMPMVPVMPGPPPPPPPTQHQQQFLRQLVDERASSTGPQRRPAGESTRKSPGPQPAEPQPPSVDRAAQVVSDIRDEVRAIVHRGDSELGGGVARLLNEIDSIRSDIRAHKDRYQAMPPAEATATTSAGQFRPTTSAGQSRPTSMLPQYQSSPAMSAIEPPADRSTPAVSLSGLSRFEINGAGSGGAGAAAAPEKKRRSYPLNEYLRRDPLPDRSVYPSYDSVLEAERRQQEAAGSHKPEDSVAAAQRTLLEVRRRQKALETRAQTAERSRDGKLIYSIVDAIWQDEAAAQRARVRAIVDDVIKHGGAIRQRAVPGARRTRVQQPPEEAPLPIRAIFDAVSESELARLCSPQKAAPAGGQRRKLGPWQRMPYMHFANDVKGPITALPRQPAEEPPRRRAAPTSAVPKRREPKPPQTREEAVQAGSPPRDDRRDDGNDGDDEDGASVEGAGVRLPGYHRPPPRRPAPPTGPSRRRPSAEDAAAASQPAGRVRAGHTADAVRSRMRDEVLAEVLARMVDQRRRPSGAPPERANSAGLDALIRRMILSALLARVERAARRLAGRDVQPPGGAAFSTPEATPRDDEQPETATESTPTPRTPTPAAPAAEPFVPLSALQLLLQQRPEPPAPPPPPQTQPQPRAQAASPDSELSGGSTAEERQLPDQDIVSLPSRHSVRTPTPSLEEPSAATPPPQPQPIAQSSRMDTGCQTLQDAVSQTAVDVEAQTTLPIPGSPPQSAVPEVPPSATPSTPSSPATPTCADSISEGVWLLDRSEGQAPNIQVATEARQLLGQLDASNGEAAFDLTADQSLADPPTRSEGEFPRRAPSHRADPRRDPVLAVIAGSDGRPLYPPPPGRRHRSDAAAAAAAAAAADFADSSAGSSLSEPGGPDNGDDVTDIIGDDDDDAELPPPSPPPPPAPVPSRPPPPPSSSSAAARASEPSEPLRPSQSPPAQRESLQLRDSAAADDRTAMASTAEFSTEATDRPDVDPDAYLGLSSTATNLLSTNQAIQDAFAATADSASLGTTGPRRLTVNVPGLDPVAGSSPDEADSVSEISLGGGL